MGLLDESEYMIPHRENKVGSDSAMELGLLPDELYPYSLWAYIRKLPDSQRSPKERKYLDEVDRAVNARNPGGRSQI